MHQSVLKKIRSDQCLSQEELANKSNISIKTIQRIETGKSAGSAYSIRQLALALNIEPDVLKNSVPLDPKLTQEEIDIIKKINLSALAVILIPLTNILIPIVYFNKNKEHPIVKDVGKRIISVQILWTFFALLLMVIISLFSSASNAPYAGSIPIFVLAYFLAVFINIIIILRIAFLLSNRNLSELGLPNLL